MRIPLPAFVVPIVFALLYFLVPGLRERPWTAMRIAGAALGVAGYALVLTARVQLGKSFSVHAKATELVTHGLYSRIRNPMFICVDLMILGLLLALDLRWFLLALPILAILQVRQAHREARVLEAKFGDACREYKENTWF
jgi:protein-S-isoprenylcysteine O-methyltransferase Ste14